MVFNKNQRPRSVSGFVLYEGEIDKRVEMSIDVNSISGGQLFVNKMVLICMIIILNILLVGCGEAVDQSSDHAERVIDQVPQPDETNEICELINSEDLYQAIQQLKPEYEFPRSFIDNSTIQQLMIHNEQDYFIAWTEHMTASPDLPVLAIFNEKKEPIYVRSFGKGIESVKYIGELVMDKGMIEVTWHHWSGSFSGQWVEVLVLDGDSVHEAWEHQTINNDEYVHEYSTYIIMSGRQLRFAEVEAPMIIVHHTSERIHVDENDQVISRNTESNQIKYVWDEKQLKFVKKE